MRQSVKTCHDPQDGSSVETDPCQGLSRYVQQNKRTLTG